MERLEQPTSGKSTASGPAAVATLDPEAIELADDEHTRGKVSRNEL